MLGFRGVGKSSLVTQFVENRFVENYDPTIENTFQKVLSINKLEVLRFLCSHLRFTDSYSQIKVDIVDTAGMDEFTPVSRRASVGVHGYIILYSVTSRSSFERIKAINERLLDLIGFGVPVPRVVVGSMSDLDARREVSFEEAQQLADEWDVPFMECSSKHDINIADVFIRLIQVTKQS